MLIADLHLHSPYARGTSRNLNLPDIAKYAKLKGLNLIGISDIFHTDWQKHAKNKLSGDGFYELDDINFVAAGEVSTVWHQDGYRKVHHLLLMPDLDTAMEFRKTIEPFGDWKDGRPMIKMSAEEFVTRLLDFSPESLVIPAHIWTPWFGAFGSKSGFDSIAQTYGAAADKIAAIETGLSSDPEMNWTVRELDSRAILSFSDAHSFWPHRLGRELTVFDAEPSYNGLRNAITKNRVKYTVEVDPNYGKYHYDGHRKCNVSVTPEEAEKLNNTCPVCGRPLTKGVLHRLHDLADRKLGHRTPAAKPFFKIVPLMEIFAYINPGSPTGSVNMRRYFSAIEQGGSELAILLELDQAQLEKIVGKSATELIMKMRKNQLCIEPGYDGEYGKIADKQARRAYTTLSEF